MPSSLPDFNPATRLRGTDILHLTRDPDDVSALDLRYAAGLLQTDIAQAAELAKGCTISNGATSGRCAVLTNGTLAAVAGSPYCPRIWLPTVPTSTLGSVQACLLDIASALSATALANSLRIYFTGNDLVIRQTGATTGDYRDLTSPGFRTLYSGQSGYLVPNFTAGDSATAPVISWQGADISAAFTASTAGTPPNWMDAALDTTYTHIGAYWPNNRIPAVTPINAALTTAEALECSATGRLPPWAEQAGSQVDIASAWGGMPSPLTGFSGTGGNGISSTTDPDDGGNAVLSCTAGAGYTGFVGPATVSIIAAKRYKIVGRARWTATPDGTQTSPAVNFVAAAGTVSSGTALSVSATFDWASVAVGSWSNFELYTDVVTTAPDARLRLRIFDTGSAALLVDDVQITPLGKLWDHVPQPGLLALADVSGNALPARLVGMSNVCRTRRFELAVKTSLASDEQALGGAIFENAANVVLDADMALKTAGTPTVKVGHTSGGTQYVASGALTATINAKTAATRIVGGTSLYVGSTTTDEVTTIITGKVIG